MDHLERAGMYITLILMISGSFLTVLEDSFPEESFGIPAGLSQYAIGKDRIQELIDQFNEDLQQIARSGLLAQIWFGGAAIVKGAEIFMNILAIPFVNWTIMVGLMFAPVAGTPAAGLALPLEILLGVIVIYTILKFLGGIIKSLPFFGG